jgi:hypothetical protein
LLRDHRVAHDELEGVRTLGHIFEGDRSGEGAGGPGCGLERGHRRTGARFIADVHEPDGHARRHCTSVTVAQGAPDIDGVGPAIQRPIRVEQPPERRVALVEEE